MPIDFSPLIGVGNVVHEQNNARDEFNMQQAHLQEQDKLQTHRAMVSHFADLSADPNALPEVRDVATRAYLDLGSRSYKDVKPKDYQNWHQQIADTSVAARKAQLQKTLGIQAQGQEGAVQDIGASGMPGSGTIGAGVDAVHSMLRNVIQDHLSNDQVSNSPYYTPQERNQQSVDAFKAQQEAALPYERRKLEMERDIVPKDRYINTPGGLYDTVNKTVVQGTQRYNKDIYNLDQAYSLYGQEHGLTKEQVEADPQMATEARQEWADKVAKTQYRTAGTWKQNPDPFGPPYIFEPTPTNAIRGGQVVGRVGTGGKVTGSNANVGNLASSVSREGVLGNDATGSSLSASHDPSAVLTGEDYIKTLPPQEQSVVKQIGEYRLPPAQLSGMGGSMRGKMKLMSDVEHAYPGFDAKEYAARYKFLVDLKSGGGMNGQALSRINMTIHHMETLKNAYEAMHNVQLHGATSIFTKGMNAARNYIADAKGQPAPGNFDAAADLVATELSKAIRGSGAVTKDEIDHWRSTLSRSMSPDQFHSRLNELVEMLKARIQAVDEQWQFAMKQQRDKSVLWPTTRESLQRMGMDAADIDSAADQPPLFEKGQPSQQTPAPAPAARSAAPAGKSKAAVPSVPNRYSGMTDAQIQQELARQMAAGGH